MTDSGPQLGVLLLLSFAPNEELCLLAPNPDALNAKPLALKSKSQTSSPQVSTQPETCSPTPNWNRRTGPLTFPFQNSGPKLLPLVVLFFFLTLLLGFCRIFMWRLGSCS